ncbi:glycosyltransferase family 4 protein [uncultured Ferrovibrio sp.]|jgi:glycosyltransferase involved in cell wall biosynthesis|uniref:glycosyltransferase family 4 protein n=1 Tax=uncultured Ferrovibrio sp. TaxID=1576913 RepID=UPI002619165F|nr:glycosyltransferase family 4 protein [uncultured Ferrovibrio sp.]
MIRVLHISPADGDGGAMVGAYKLHKAVQAAGVDSQMLVLRKYTDDPTVIPRSGSPRSILEIMRDPLDRIPLKIYDWSPHNWWSVGWLPFNIREAVDRLKPDIVQFHWAGRGAVPIKTISQLRDYPIVWTLRDMWPLTGGCHYAGDCNKYMRSCGACPQLGSKSNFDISRWQWKRKYRAWHGTPITYIALSNWIAECARQSPLTFDNEITVIPNGVDVDRFRPVDKITARRIWGLPLDKKIILFGAVNVHDPRKGFSYLSKAIHLLNEQGWGDKVQLVAFGNPLGSTQFDFPVRYVGRLHDDLSLALLYACADVMAAPSVYENAAKTVLEAMACGVPVAAFANTGQVDLIDHKLNGYLAQNLSAEDLALGIAWCLAEENRDSLAQEARAKVLRCFDISKIAQHHVALYERLIAARGRATANDSLSGLDAEAVRSMIDDTLMRPQNGRVS